MSVRNSVDFAACFPCFEALFNRFNMLNFLVGIVAAFNFVSCAGLRS